MNTFRAALIAILFLVISPVAASAQGRQGDRDPQSQGEPGDQGDQADQEEDQGGQSADGEADGEADGGQPEGAGEAAGSEGGGTAAKGRRREPPVRPLAAPEAPARRRTALRRGATPIRVRPKPTMPVWPQGQPPPPRAAIET
ncbi:MAG: hypothetical protein JRH11_28135 [Deltaproteobacteria bacterium]|nr:hypothetical protein [Deltaproteobacteria bacterium]